MANIKLERGQAERSGCLANYPITAVIGVILLTVAIGLAFNRANVSQRVIEFWEPSLEEQILGSWEDTNGFTMTFRADGTLEQAGGLAFSDRYAFIEDDVIRIWSSALSSLGASQDFRVSIDNNILYLTPPSGGVIVYRRLTGASQDVAPAIEEDIDQAIVSDPPSVESGWTAGRIAFSAGASQKELYVAAPDGSGLEQLTALAADEITDIGWSPDARRLAFTVKTGEMQGVYTLELTSGRLAPISQAGENAFGVRWSPDGGKLLYLAHGVNESLSLIVVENDGTGHQRLMEGEFATTGYADWSPNQRTIAWAVENGSKAWIYLMDSDGGNVRLFAEDMEQFIPPEKLSAAQSLIPNWSPDSSRISLYLSAINPGLLLLTFVADVESGNLTLINQPGELVGAEGWSLDGTELFIGVSDEEGANEDYDYSLQAVNVDGVRRLIDSGVEISQLTECGMSPDGEYLLTYSYSEQRYFIIPADSGARIEFAPFGSSSDLSVDPFACWSPR